MSIQLIVIKVSKKSFVSYLSFSIYSQIIFEGCLQKKVKEDKQYQIVLWSKESELTPKFDYISIFFCYVLARKQVFICSNFVFHNVSYQQYNKITNISRKKQPHPFLFNDLTFVVTENDNLN